MLTLLAIILCLNCVCSYPLSQNDKLGIKDLPGLPQNIREKLINCSTKLDEYQKKNFEKRIQNWWKQFIAKLQQTAKRVGDFFSSLVNQQPMTIAQLATTSTTISPVALYSESDLLCKEGIYDLVTRSPLDTVKATTKEKFYEFLLPPTRNKNPYPEILPDLPKSFTESDIKINELPIEPVIKDSS